MSVPERERPVHAATTTELGYGSPALARASACARTLWFQRPRGWARVALVLRLPALVWWLGCYLARLPTATLPLSDGPQGRMIAEHLLGPRRWGLPRFRLAQGILYLPADLESYLRGRHRQAVRTNLRRARERGLTCRCDTIAGWLPVESGAGDRGLTQPAASERWRLQDPAGACVCEAWLTVDRDVALLHQMGSSQRNVRWMLHTLIVERLCASSCQILVTNSYDAPLLSEGQQHFQRLAGYTVARLRPMTPATVSARRARWRITALASIALAAIAASQALIWPAGPPGHRALVWVSAVVAVRLAARRRGAGTLIGVLAGAVVAVLGLAADPTVSVAYVVCGLATDGALAVWPRLGDRAATMALLGAVIVFAALIAPDFPTLGHEPAHEASVITLAAIVGAAVFGALGGALGRQIALAAQPQAAPTGP